MKHSRYEATYSEYTVCAAPRSDPKKLEELEKVETDVTLVSRLCFDTLSPTEHLREVGRTVTGYMQLVSLFGVTLITALGSERGRIQLVSLLA